MERFARENQKSLSPTTEKRFFELFLNGKTTEEIHALNPGFALGAIVLARLEGEWDNKLKEYRQRLLAEAENRVKQVQLEAVYFVADCLSATHKFQGEAIQRYLQTGDANELRAIGIDLGNPKQYKQLIELLLKLTGQDKGANAPSVSVNVQGDGPITIANDGSGQFSPTQADEILKIINGEK